MEDGKRLKAALGEFTFNLYGHNIRAMRVKGVSLPVPKWYEPKLDVYLGTWVQWRDLYQPIVCYLVRDWDELAYEDLWRDPEKGIRFIRALHGK